MIAALLTLAAAVLLPPVNARLDYQIGGEYPLLPGARWPRDLVLGEDPAWPGERALDVSTARKRDRIARRLGRTLRRCAAKGFEAVGQKNVPQLDGRRIGLDFAIAEECARECARYRAAYADRVLDVEYRRRDFRRACRVAGERISVVLRDRDVSTPRSSGYGYAAC